MNYKDLADKLKNSSSLGSISDFILQYRDIKEDIDTYVIDTLIAQMKIISHIDTNEYRPIPYIIRNRNMNGLIGYLRKYRYIHSYTIDEISSIDRFLHSYINASICYSLILIL